MEKEIDTNRVVEIATGTFIAMLAYGVIKLIIRSLCE